MALPLSQKRLAGELARALRALAFAFYVGVVGALLEFGFFAIIWATWHPLPILPPGLFDLSDPTLIYGVRGPWQLLAHKVFAFGWLLPALTVVFVLATAPLYPLYRRLGVRTWRLGIALAAGAVCFFDYFVALSLQLLSGLGSPQMYCKLLFYVFPTAALILAAAFYLVFSSRWLARFAAWRPGPAVAAAIYAGVAVLSFLPRGPRPPTPTGPNVLLITIDTLRADKVGPRESGATLTPNIDRFAADATTFRRCVAAAPWTLPSLATVFTGLNPPVHGAGLEAPLAAGFDTLAELFARRGYDTGAACGNTMCEPRFGFAQGFQYYKSMEMLTYSVPTRLYYTKLLMAVHLINWLRSNTTPTVKKRAQTFIGSRRGRPRPFFLWVHFLDPHGPYTPPPEYVSPTVNAYRAKASADEPTAIDKKVEEDLYDGEVRFVDAAVGQILAGLEDNGLVRSTVVIVSSDHGEEFWEHGSGGHGHTLYDELITVPLIIRAPELLPAGAVRSEQVASIDIFATLVDICDLAPTKPYQGKSILKRSITLPEGPAALAFSSSVNAGDRSRVAVSDGRMKLILSPKAGTEELFNLAADPGEHIRAVNPAEAARLRAAIRAWMADNEDMKRRYGVSVRPDAAIERNIKALGYAN